MRKIIAGLFISLDGVVEAPQDWHFPYFNEEMGEAVSGTHDTDVMLFGRVSHEPLEFTWRNSEQLQGDFVEAVAKRLLAAVREPVRPHADAATEVRVDASIGITELDPSEGVEATLARVDLAMREAKVTGRGRWVRHRLG